MTDAYTQPALLRFRDVVHVVLATAGLTLLLVVAGMLLYSVMVMFGFTGTSILTLPVLFALEAISIVGGIWFGLLRRRRLTGRDIGWLPTRPAWLFAAGFAAGFSAGFAIGFDAGIAAAGLAGFGGFGLLGGFAAALGRPKEGLTGLGGIGGGSGGCSPGVADGAALDRLLLIFTGGGSM